MNELKNNEQFFEHHQDARARIDGRENCHLRLQAEKPVGLTMGDVTNRRKKELINDMLSKFGNVTVGIHGQELPKFAETEDSKYWWKLKNNKPTPTNQSLAQYKQNMKYWARDDQILLADVNTEPAPIDQFKVEHVPQKKKLDIPDKVNHVMHCAAGDLQELSEHQRGYQPKVRWTENVKDMHKGGDRYYGAIVTKAYQAEKDAVERERKLDEFYRKPKRGMVKMEEDVIEKPRRKTIVSNSVQVS